MEGRMKPHVLLGTCSWKFPSWHPLVYSAPDGINYLAEYAARYKTVEIDQWFWSLFGETTVSLPRKETVAEYLEAVGSDFAFTIKVPNSITLTHFYRSIKEVGGRPNPYFLSRELFTDFLECIAPMRRQTRALMFQFEYLNKQKMSGLSEFTRRMSDFLAGLPSDWTYAVECRNPNYLKPPYFDMLASHGVGHVFLQGYYMPPVTRIYQLARERLCGPRIMRLLGPDRSGIEKETGKKWDTIVWPRDEEISQIAQVARDQLDRGQDVIVNVNNHYEGSAPLTIERFRTALKQL